jgi:hypothetical protein
MERHLSRVESSKSENTNFPAQRKPYPLFCNSGDGVVDAPA